MPDPVHGPANYERTDIESKQNMHVRIRFKRGKGENIVKPKLHSRIRQSQEFLQRCFHFSPSNGDGGRGAGMPIRADEREEKRKRRKGIIIPLGMRTSLVTDNGSGGGAKTRKKSEGIQQSN